MSIEIDSDVPRPRKRAELVAQAADAFRNGHFERCIDAARSIAPDVWNLRRRKRPFDGSSQQGKKLEANLGSAISKVLKEQSE